MSYSVLGSRRAPLGATEDADPFLGDCAFYEVFNEDTGQCEPYDCPGDEAPYYGTCMDLDTQQELAELLCDDSQRWSGPGYASCTCKVGYVRAPDSYPTKCMPAPTPVKPSPDTEPDTETPWPREDQVQSAAVSVKPPTWVYWAAGAVSAGAVIAMLSS